MEMKVLIVADRHGAYCTVKAMANGKAVVSTVDGDGYGNPYIVYRTILKELAEKVGLEDYLSFKVAVAHVTSGTL